jgi:phospholipid transport system substrate-binding protein
MAVAVPAGKEPPIVLDMATTVAEYGKVKTKAQRGETMPVGWSRCILDDPAGRCCGSCLQFYEFGDTTPAGALDRAFTRHGMAVAPCCRSTGTLGAVSRLTHHIGRRVRLQREKIVKRLIAFLCLAVMAGSYTAGAAETSPDALVKSTADEVLTIIRTTKDKKVLRELAEKKVLPHFDFRAMTQLAVGRYWREATPAQQKALEEAFRSLLVNTYTASLNVASTGKELVEVKPAETKPGENDVVVRTLVRSPNRPQPIPVDYRMTKGPDGWKVYDVIVENLSLVTNYRSSFASEIQRSGIDGLIKVLQAKNSELA